jgi:hypothetical protein
MLQAAPEAIHFKRILNFGEGQRQLLIDFWLGHDNSDMASRYAKQLTEDMEFRQEWAEKVGLGFVLPEASEREQSTNCATCDTKSITHDCIATA